MCVRVFGPHVKLVPPARDPFSFCRGVGCVLLPVNLLNLSGGVVVVCFRCKAGREPFSVNEESSS